MKFKKVLSRDIIISSSHNEGFIVKVGCCTLAYANADSLIADLKEYLANPGAIDKQYDNSTELNQIRPTSSLSTAEPAECEEEEQPRLRGNR